MLHQVSFDKAGNPVGLNRRAKRVARGSGTSVREVEELLAQARMMAGMARQAGGQNGWYVANSFCWSRPSWLIDHGPQDERDAEDASSGGWQASWTQRPTQSSAG
jgi:hypothetical protein